MFLLAVSTGIAEESGAPAKSAPTDMAVIKSCGGDLATMFAKFGQPLDLVATRGPNENLDRVICDYGPFLFGFRDQKIVGCFFRKTWKGPIMGISIGDTRETVVKVLGVASKTFRDKNGVVTDYGYPMKDLGVLFYANFDAASGKLIRVEIAPLE